MLRHLVLLIFLAIASGSAKAGEAQHIDVVDSKIAAEASRTYAQLLKQVFADVAKDGTDFKVTGLSHKVRMGKGDDRPEPDGARVESVEALPVRVAGTPRLALLITLESEEAEGFAILALYSKTDAPVLLDALQVASDRTTAFMETADIPISQHTDAIAIMNEHTNSDQAYDFYQLFALVGDRLVEIDNVFAISDRTCSYERQDKVSFLSKPGNPYFDIVTSLQETVTEVDGCDGDGNPQTGDRIYNRTSRWNNKLGKYVTTPSELDKLEKSMDDRM